MARTEPTTKKRPPTFQHLPVKRAKKLKRAWVDTKKIKSKWRAEKRKVLAGGSASIEQHQQKDDIQGGGGNFEASNEPDAADEDLDARPIIPPSQPPPTRMHMEDSWKEQIPEEKGISLRNMTREAYSRSSLHTYKSDPFRHGWGRGGAARRGHGAGGTNPSARGIGQGRGQPNMRLRMGVMLEKIKRDYS